MYSREPDLDAKNQVPAQRARSASTGSPVPPLLALQRMAGNEGVSRAIEEGRGKKRPDAVIAAGAAGTVPVQRAGGDYDYSGWANEAQQPAGGMSATLFGSSSSGGADYSGWANEAQQPAQGMSATLFGPRSSGGQGQGRGPGPARERTAVTVPSGALAAALVSVDVNRLPPETVWRRSHEPLYRNDSRPWYIVFKQGFAPKNTSNLDLKDFLHSNAPSAFVATTRKADMNWPFEGGDAYIYQIEAPGGIDANATYPQTLSADKYDEAEVDFPGGIAPQFIKGCWALQEDGGRKWIPNDGSS